MRQKENPNKHDIGAKIKVCMNEKGDSWIIAGFTEGRTSIKNIATFVEYGEIKDTKIFSPEEDFVETFRNYKDVATTTQGYEKELKTKFYILSTEVLKLDSKTKRVFEKGKAYVEHNVHALTQQIPTTIASKYQRKNSNVPDNAFHIQKVGSIQVTIPDEYYYDTPKAGIVGRGGKFTRGKQTMPDMQR